MRDERPHLLIAEGTWQREDDDGRQRLIHAAAAQGYRLVIGFADGQEWSPPDDPIAWPPRRRA